MRSGYWNDNPAGRVLTDRRIKHYILEGRYGDAARQRLLERQKPKPKNALRLALKLLDL